LLTGQAVEAILDIPLAFTPGEDVVYSCLGFILLGKILESVRGDSLDRLSNRYVFEQLEMKNTCLTPKEDNIASTDFDRKTGECSKGIVNDCNASSSTT
jgi:CubicO group peptidase (beta-lactamase class C family)